MPPHPPAAVLPLSVFCCCFLRDLLCVASYDTFEEEFAAIVASECAREPRAEGKLKAFAQFIMGGVVDRAELAEK